MHDQHALTSVPTIVTIKELDDDPHGMFRRLRPERPFLTREDGVNIVLRAADVRKLITDPRTRQAETELPRLRGLTQGAIFDLFQYGMLTSNGPAHSRRRAPFATTFSFRLIADLKPRIRRLAETLIDRFDAGGEVDLLENYATLMPAHMIGEILGLPPSDIPHFTRLVYSVSRILGTSYKPEEVLQIDNEAAQLVDYADRLLQERRASPRDDFLTAYGAAADQGEMAPFEILAQVVGLIIAGSDTTRAAMSTQVALLLQHREQWDAVCSDPQLIPGAVSEALRFEPSVASFNRFTLEDIEIDGHVLPAGKFITLSTMSAMRDPDLYQVPDTFDIRRTDQQKWHLVFGGGPHRCLGEALARFELEEGLAALAARFPHLRLTGEPPKLRGHVSIRRVEPLHVGWS